MISLTYIYHSCFLLKAGQCCSIVFDYWKESADEPRTRYDRQGFPKFLDDIPAGLPLYVVISHHHKDHFNPSVFRWRERFNNIHYILSKDTATFARRYLIHLPKECYTVMSYPDTFQNDGLSIKAYPSTDIGNAYVASISLPAGKEGNRELTVLHAGDLNAWLWLDESTPAEIEDMTQKWRSSLNLIAKDFPRLHLAMFPVDSRIGREYFAGAAELVKSIMVSRFFPMHFELADTLAELQKRHADARRFELFSNPRFGEFIALQSYGATWAATPVCL